MAETKKQQEESGWAVFGQLIAIVGSILLGAVLVVNVVNVYTVAWDYNNAKRDLEYRLSSIETTLNINGRQSAEQYREVMKRLCGLQPCPKATPDPYIITVPATGSLTYTHEGDWTVTK